MTRDEFLKGYGADFRKFARRETFRALLQVIDDESPVKRLESVASTDRFNGAVMYLSEIKGWEDLRKFIEGLDAEPSKETEVPDTFAHPEPI